MWRDFHLIRDETADILFFPATYRLFRVSRVEGDVLAAFLGGDLEALPQGPAAQIIAAEAVKAAAIPKSHRPWGETDSLCLYVAHDCNLNCTYCYNHRGQDIHPGLMMKPEVAEAAFRRFFITPGMHYAVAFYGGEPLLNFRAIKAIVAMGRQLEMERRIYIAFSITTNGTLLNREIQAFLHEHFFSVTVSVDGPQEIHDLHRVGAKGGSYARIMANVARLKAQGGPRLALKGTLAREGVVRYRESLEHLKQSGCQGVILTPVDMSGGSAADLSDADYEQFVAQHEALNAAAVDGGFNGSDHLPEEALTVIANLLTRRKLRRHCNAGRDLALAADGSLYACHGLVGQPEFFMGKVDDVDHMDFQRVRDIFAGLEVDRLPECAVCWARYFCGGSCYAKAYAGTGSVTAPDPRHCLLVKRCAETVIRRFLAATAQEETRQALYTNMRRFISVERKAAHA
ncbi:MAG: hypothetical protein C0489_05945 [Candidatus Accumulibacter sp.]|nr:hypothetical protein [Accumulibacter sp.]MBA4093614.1 hypothetical protein [Accumulibacter sp.]